jgi:hypothetical protein
LNISLDGSSSSKSTEAAKPITDNELKAVSTKGREKPVESSFVSVPAPVQPIASENAIIVEEVKKPSVVVEKTKKQEEEKATEPTVVDKYPEEIALGDFQRMQNEIVKSGKPKELLYENQLSSCSLTKVGATASIPLPGTSFSEFQGYAKSIERLMS